MLYLKPTLNMRKDQPSTRLSRGAKNQPTIPPSAAATHGKAIRHIGIVWRQPGPPASNVRPPIGSRPACKRESRRSARRPIAAGLRRCPSRRGLSNRADNAGLRVSETNIEMSVETAMVKANWRKNCPVMPLMKAHGMNTADSTKPIATTGPDTCSIARTVASCGDIPSSM